MIHNDEQNVECGLFPALLAGDGNKIIQIIPINFYKMCFVRLNMPKQSNYGDDYFVSKTINIIENVDVCILSYIKKKKSSH